MNDLMPLIAALGVLGYALLKWRLNKLAQPLRLDLAERGEALRADPHIPENLKDVVEFELDGAFGHGPWLVAAWVLIPLAAIWIAVTGRDGVTKGLSDRLRGQYDEFTELSTRLSFLNNPILMTVLSIQIVLWFGISTVIGALAGRAVSFVRAPAVMASVHAKFHHSAR